MSEKSPTVWQIMSSSTRDLMAARAAIPFVIAVVYGCYKFTRLGLSADHYLYTYIPAVGGLVAALGIAAYAGVTMHDRRGFGSFFGAASGWLPYLMSLYMIGFLGVYGLWRSLDPMSTWGAAKGLVWAYLGYRGLRKFWIITELSSVRVDESDLAEVLVTKLRLSKRDLLPLSQDSAANEYFAARHPSGD